MKPPIVIQTAAEQRVNELRKGTRQLGLIRQSNNHWRKRMAYVLYDLAKKLEPTPPPPTPHAS